MDYVFFARIEEDLLGSDQSRYAVKSINRIYVVAAFQGIAVLGYSLEQMKVCFFCNTIIKLG